MHLDVAIDTADKKTEVLKDFIKLANAEKKKTENYRTAQDMLRLALFVRTAVRNVQ